MPWMLPSVTATLLGSALLGVTFLYLHHAYRDRYLLVWAMSWGVYALRFAAMLGIVLLGRQGSLVFFNQAFGLLSGTLLLTGTLMFLGRRVSAGWWALTAAGIGYIACGVSFGFSFRALTLPTFSFLALVDIWAGIAFLRHSPASGLGANATGWAFILWGLHKADYPWLQPVAWFAPWGYLLGAVLACVVALGILLTYFERLRAELANTAGKYRALFDASPYGIGVADPATGIILDANLALAELVGRRREELIGQPQKVLHPSAEPQRDEVTRTFQQHLGDDRGRVLRSQLVTSSGEVRDVEIKSDYVFLDGTRLVQGFFNDIGERARAEQQLERQRYYLEKAQELGRIGTWELDVPRNRLYWTDENCRIFGVPPGSVVTYEVFIDKVHPADRDYVDREWKAALQGKPYDLEHRVLVEGATRWVREKADLEFDAQGGALRAVGITQDVTERHEAEEALAASEERYRALFANVADVVYRTDAEGTVELMSPSCERLFGFGPEEVVGRKIRDFYAEPHRRDALLEELATRGEVTDFQAQIRCKDGSLRWVSTNARMLRGDGGEPAGVEGITRDISGLKKSEEERRLLEEQLRQTQKVEAIGRLAGGVAHDFNNMLSVILGYSDLLLEGSAPLDGEVRSCVQQIKDAAERSAGITRQLLAFARKQVANPKVLDLNEVVDGILKMLRRLIGEDIDLTWHPLTGLRKVFIDPSQIDQILANLATNARDSLAGVGRVTIETANAELDEEYCRSHPDCSPGRYVVLTVSDSGVGIPKEDLGTIFEPFYTTKPDGQGTGLGLATVHGIAKQNGGFINVYSEVGHGTTFRIYLPAHEDETPVVHWEGTAARKLSGTETLLLVEDEVSILQLAARIFRDLGYNVLEAGTPAAALHLAEDHSGPIDLLVTDVVMPGMNGKELSGRLSAGRPGLRTVYLSGYTANVIAERGLLKEGVNFVPKPFSPVELAAKVREVLDR